MLMPPSLYPFRAVDHPLAQLNDRRKLREAKTGFILAGHIPYRFDDHVVAAGPGDMLPIPAGPAHRHQPRVVETEIVRYVLTEFATP